MVHRLHSFRGIEQGFRIGKEAELNSRMTNTVSASEQPTVVASYLEEEQRQGRVVKVCWADQAKDLKVHCSFFGVIPKRKRENQWRLNLDLSSPDGCSVNDGIQKALASLSYVSVDDVVARGAKGLEWLRWT